MLQGAGNDDGNGLLPRWQFGARGANRQGRGGKAMQFLDDEAFLNAEQEKITRRIKRSEKKIDKIVEEYYGDKKKREINDGLLKIFKKDKDFVKYYNRRKRAKEYEAKIERIREANTVKAWGNDVSGGLEEESASMILAKESGGMVRQYIGLYVPFLAPFVNRLYNAYGWIKVALDEGYDASVNIWMGTRQRSSAARLAGVVTGAIVGGALLGGLLAGIGSAIPFVGTFIGGTFGIVAGGIVGAAIGARIGMMVFERYIKNNPALQEEYDREMDYVHLSQLSKAYGLNREIILYMHNYLRNQIKISSPERGKVLEELRKNALEKGGEKSLIKLCHYFITKEKLLRSGLHDLSDKHMLNALKKKYLWEEKISLLGAREVNNKKRLDELEVLLKENINEKKEIEEKYSEIKQERQGIIAVLKEVKNPSETDPPPRRNIYNTIGLTSFADKLGIDQLFRADGSPKEIEEFRSGPDGHPFALVSRIKMEHDNKKLNGMRQNAFTMAQQVARCIPPEAKGNAKDILEYIEAPHADITVSRDGLKELLTSLKDNPEKVSPEVIQPLEEVQFFLEQAALYQPSKKQEASSSMASSSSRAPASPPAGQPVLHGAVNTIGKEKEKEKEKEETPSQKTHRRSLSDSGKVSKK